MTTRISFSKYLTSACVLFSLTACANLAEQEQANIDGQDPLSLADPFIGTGGHGHTFPGPFVPFGMVQLSPDNPSKGWDWTSGYHYSDNVLVGFSHTHLSGTGVGDLLDVLVMPFRGDYLQRQRDDKGRIFSHYSHDDEQASPGYYQLGLPEEAVNVELTASERAGFHRYQFRGEKDAQLLVDLGYAQNYDKPVSTLLRVEDDYTLSGYRLSTGWAKYQPIYFTARFSQPFTHTLYNLNEHKPESGPEPVKGDQLLSKEGKIVLNFGDISDKPLEVAVGISYVSIDGAKANLAAENPGSFDLAQSRAEQSWRKQLGKFTVEDDNRVNKTKFYTALYHAFTAPQIFHDVDGSYFGADGSSHANPDYGKYSLFSLWDTFRALHPLLTITDADRVDDMVKSMLGFYQETGLLPTWDLMSNETDVMIGYHAVPVLVDAYLKGLTTADPELLFEACKASAMQDRFGIDLFRQYGYIPSELEVEAVSKTLEYAYDDWAIAQLAKALGKQQEFEYFNKRSQAYRQMFDKSTGFMRGKTAQGDWVEPFNPTYVEHRNTDYTEANAWQYSFFVPHDVPGLISLFGSEAAFVEKLDKLFTVSSEMQGDVSPDISGLIGQYAHGNEPVHHVTYLYAYTQDKWKGEQRIREIRDTMYLAAPDGLAGNDDLGQMSAWYVFSALGFYPLNPVGGVYVLGTPQFEQVKLALPDNKHLNIRRLGAADGYVSRVLFNGIELEVPEIDHRDLMRGGELVFEMTPTH